MRIGDRNTRWRWLALASLLISSQIVAQSVDADIDAVQRKLDAAKKVQADREAVQRANAAAKAKMGALVVKADRDCELSVNGESKGRLIAEQTSTVKVQAGEQLIECVSEGRQRVEVTQRVPAGEQVVVRLTVRQPERFEAVGDGVKDYDQNLLWAGSDNGGDINFADAQRYCAGKGSGWTLPSVAALQSLYDASGAHRRDLNITYNGTTHNVAVKPATPLVQVSSEGFWSNEADGTSGAWTVDLTDGTRVSSAIDYASYKRALCVRRS